jgi:hypothetical protein
MQLYKAYSLIPSSRLTGNHEEEDIRIDWVCYFRDENLPCATLLENFDDLVQTAEIHEDRDYLRWIQQRTNNLLKREEVEELEAYLHEKYDFPIYIENMRFPVKLQDLPWFKENYVDSMIILSGRDDPFTLSTCIVGMVSPYKDLSNVFTVREFLNEIDKQQSSKGSLEEEGF